MWITLALYLGMAALGIVVSRVVKPGEKTMSFSQKLQTIALMIVIFSMGMKIGADERVVASLPTIGLKAFLLTAAAVGCSALFVYGGRRIMKLDGRGCREDD